MDLEDCNFKSQQHRCTLQGHFTNLRLHPAMRVSYTEEINRKNLPDEPGQQAEAEKAKQEWEKYVRRFSES